jgi:uncharacterized RDD family membrane protein YckC
MESLGVAGRLPALVMAVEAATGMRLVDLLGSVAIALLVLTGVALVFAHGIAQRLVRWRAERLPEPLCGRLREEWLGEIAALTPLRKLIFALGVALTRARTFSLADAEEEGNALAKQVVSQSRTELRVAAGLWPRVTASVIDLAFMMLIAVALMPIHAALALSFPLNRLNDLTPSLPLWILFNVWCVVRVGGSPGKLMMKLRITAVADTPLTWRHAWLRITPMLLIHVVLVVLTTMAFLSSGLDAQGFAALSAPERDALAGTPLTGFFGLAALAFIVADLFMTCQDADHRSLRDRIAGTVVVCTAPRFSAETEVLESPRPRLIVLLLCLFLGCFGAHRFYLGKIGTGVLMFVTLGGLGLWMLVDVLVIAAGSMRDAERRRVYRWLEPAPARV